MFCRGTIFLEAEFLISYQECRGNVGTFPSSFRLVPHNVSGIPATLWLTMWPECEEFVRLKEDAYSGEILKNVLVSIFDCFRKCLVHTYHPGGQISLDTIPLQKIVVEILTRKILH